MVRFQRGFKQLDFVLKKGSALIIRLFFLRLPIGQYGPVSQLSCPQLENEAAQVHLIGAEPIVQVKT